MINFYRCFNHIEIPNIKINKNNVIVQCIETNIKKEISISDYCKFYINKINIGKNSFPLIFYCKQHNLIFSCYCNDCKRNICFYCKYNHKSHKIFPDDNMRKENEELKQFIYQMKLNIKKIKDIIEKLEYKLVLYESILLNENFIITYESINNFKNLDILKNIKGKQKIFEEKTNELLNHLKNLESFEDLFISQEMKNNNQNEIEIELFQEPKKNLYQRNAIRIENIENKSRYIIKKITNISQNIEGINIEKRDEYLILVGFLAREAHNYAYELIRILIEEFYKKHTFNTIIFERAKVELSSWVNQSLIINKSNKEIKDLRNFYEYYSKNKFINIQYFNSSDELFEKAFTKENYNFQDLFRDLCQLYSEVLLFSENNIDIIYIQNYKFIYDKMEDITDLNGQRDVKLTILPGLFINNEPIKNGKILVYCENKQSKMKYIYNNNLFPVKNREFELKNMIKIINIINEIKVDVHYESKGTYYIFEINTVPKIPKNDNPKFSINLSRNNIELQSSESNRLFLNKKNISKSDSFFFAVEICGVMIKTRSYNI